MAKVVQALVSTDAINPDEYRKLVSTRESGAVVLFAGDVRDHHNGKQVISLEYEAHPSAQRVLQQVANDIAHNSEILRVALAHRHGVIPIGECAFVVAVSAAHRQSAFSVCQEIVDEVKKLIPIWKHQLFFDGSEEWVNFA